MKNTARQTNTVFRAFADETRLRILNVLLEGEVCVCDLCRVLRIPQPKMSRHLAYLRRARLVEVRREGKWKHYSLPKSPTGLEKTLLDCVGSCLRGVSALKGDLARLKASRGASGVGRQSVGKRDEIMTQENQDIRESVRAGYARIAQSGAQSCCGPSSCCGSGDAEAAVQLAQSIGYGADELAQLPDGANMGLSCGNPVALASLREGNVVLELGSGGGFDVFIAGRKVGPTGRAIGVDMTPEMVSKARHNLLAYREQSGLDNVEFRLGEVEHLPVPDVSMDVVISNCVVNLSPDKQQVWREIARVLKPGGHVSVSDIALLKPLPESARASVEALVGCVAGAVPVDETRAMVHAAGLTGARFECKSGYIDSMADWSDPVFRELARHFPQGTKPSEFVTSLNVTARKPETCRQTDK